MFGFGRAAIRLGIRPHSSLASFPRYYDFKVYVTACEVESPSVSMRQFKLDLL